MNPFADKLESGCANERPDATTRSFVSARLIVSNAMAAFGKRLELGNGLALIGMVGIDDALVRRVARTYTVQK